MIKNRFILLMIVFIAFTPNIKATHVVGGELIYTCLNPTNNFYRFTMKLYRDCYTGVPPFDDPIYVSIYDSLENLLIQFQIDLPTTDTLDNNTYNVCLFPPPNVCVEEAVYTADYFLPPGKYYMTYQRCCRNDSIVNMFNPLGQGAGWDITIPDTAIAICNSSPYYNQYPPTIICLDSQFVYDHSATDPDGDSLVYYLCTPNDYDNGIWGIIPNPSGPPSSNFDVTYVFPYGSAYPIWAPVDSFKIDPQTGLLTGTPTQTGRYVVGVCVSEYRNGVLLSTNKRDFQFNVAQCEDNLLCDSLQCVDSVNAGFMFLYYSLDITAVFFISDSSTNANSYYWDFGVAGITTDTSTQPNPSYTFPLVDTSYTVTLIINAGSGCADTAIQTVNIQYTNVSEYSIPSNQLSIYPNPNTGQFTLEMDLEKNTKISIKLYQITGQQIFAEEINNIAGFCSQQIDLSNYAKGIYYVQVVTGNSVFTRKVIYQ